MNNPVLPNVERGRIVVGRLASTSDMGPNGAFELSCPVTGSQLFVVASNGMGWEHVSVSIINRRRCPTWDDMNWVKDQFWGGDEAVVQYHPRKSEYVNCHPYALHLWRPLQDALPTPPIWMVGPK